MNKSEGLQIIYITGFKIKRGIYEELYAKKVMIWRLCFIDYLFEFVSFLWFEGYKLVSSYCYLLKSINKLFFLLNVSEYKKINEMWYYY